MAVGGVVSLTGFQVILVVDPVLFFFDSLTDLSLLFVFEEAVVVLVLRKSFVLRLGYGTSLVLVCHLSD